MDRLHENCLLISSKMSAVHVGQPPDEWESWESRFVHFHHFESLSTKKGKESPVFICFGHAWRVLMYPGGDDVSREGMVALYLRHCSGSEISCKFKFLIRDTSGKVVEEVMSPEYTSQWGRTHMDGKTLPSLPVR